MSDKEPEKYVTKDSGERREFDTGAVRDVTTGKGRFDLISPIPIARLAGVMERGAAKYTDRNWEKGIPLGSFVDSAKRHLDQWINGDTDEDHLGQCLWNIHCLIHTEAKIQQGKLPKELANMGPLTYVKMVLTETKIETAEQLHALMGLRGEK